MDHLTLSTTIEKCRVCGSKNIDLILDLGDQPLANALLTTPSEDSVVFPLELLRCGTCGVIQISETLEPDILFSNYVWVSGTSETTLAYLAKLAGEISSRITLDMQDALIAEIASNDGSLLRELKNLGHRIIGIDPARNIATEANNSGIPTLCEFFNEDVADSISGQEGPAHVVVARNVVPHVRDLHDVISGVDHLMMEDGFGVFEFHDCGLLPSQLHYDYIYHEHLNYFSLSTMTFLLGLYGLRIFDIIRSPISGGSFVVFFDKHRRAVTDKVRVAEQNEENGGVGRKHTWVKFAADVQRHRDVLRRLVENQHGNLMAGYGASARSSTIMNYCQIDSEKVEFVIDKNDLKRGKWTPGTKIPIVNFEEGMQRLSTCGTIFVGAWNFAHEIAKDLREGGYRGSVLCPLPGEPHEL